MKDLRDPKLLGESLLEHASSARGAYGPMPLTEVWDVHVRHLSHGRLNSNPGPLEKYGDPTKLPSTLGTPIE